MAIEVPTVTPVTIPVPAPIVAFELFTVQTPPDVASVRVVVKPTHTDDAPTMATGFGLIVITVVTLQPELMI